MERFCKVYAYRRLTQTLRRHKAMEVTKCQKRWGRTPKSLQPRWGIGMAELKLSDTLPVNIQNSKKKNESVNCRGKPKEVLVMSSDVR